MSLEEKFKPNTSQANEAHGGYSKKITVSSFEQQEKEMYLFWLNLTPEQRLQSVFEIHRRIYGDHVVFSSKKIGNRIHFDTNEYSS